MNWSNLVRENKIDIKKNLKIGQEIRANNILLKAIDGKDKRTFAYPCGDLKIGGVNFYTGLRNDFVGARGVTGGLQTADQVDLDNIDCYVIQDKPAEYMIDLVKKAQQTHTLLVFLFHGVGGGHNINENRGEHTKLLHYLKQNEKDIWVAPMVDVAEKIKVNMAFKPFYFSHFVLLQAIPAYLITLFTAYYH